MNYSMTRQAGSPQYQTRQGIDELAKDGGGLMFTGRIASWNARHRWWVIAASVLVIVLAMFVLNTVETKTLDYNGEGESAIGADLVNDRFQFNSAPTDNWSSAIRP